MKNNIIRGKISVIISTYNRKDYLDLALKSVLNQTYDNFEIIIIDDCSTDNTEEFIKNNYNIDKIKYYKNSKNLGCGISRKKAMDYTTGEYINFLDDDDKFIDKDYFKKTIKIFESNKKVAIVSGEHIVNDIVNHTKTEKKFPYKKIVNGDDFFINFSSEKYPKPIISVSIIKKEALEKAKFTEMKILNDTTIFLRTILYGDMGFINKPEAEYLVHGKNISFNCKTDFIIDNLNEKYEVYKIAKQNKKFSEKDLKMWLENQLDITIKYFINGSKPKYFNFLKIIRWYKKTVNDKEKIKEFKILYKESKRKEKTI